MRRDSSGLVNPVNASGNLMEIPTRFLAKRGDPAVSAVTKFRKYGFFSKLHVASKRLRDRKDRDSLSRSLKLKKMKNRLR